MTTLARTAVLPFDHLAAELVAFPLCSETALTAAITHLSPALDRATGRLWRAAERDLITSAPGVSLDELTAMRDDCWFAGLDGSGDPPQRPPRPLHHHLAIAARRPLAALEPALGPPATAQVVRGPRTPAPAYAQARSAWMWLTFALPADLLLATCGRPGWLPEPNLISPPVRDLLARGFAETHLHVGASLDFATVWSMLLARLASPELPGSIFLAPGAVLNEGSELAGWLVRAAIARTALSWFLARGGDGAFVQFLFGRFGDAVVREAGPGTFRLVQDAVTDLCTGALSDIPVPPLRGAYAELVGSSGPLPDAELGVLRGLDPISAVLNPGVGTPEQRLFMGMTAYLDRRDESGNPDPVAATLFWQTVRVRVLVYRHLTQRPLTPGLPWFIRFYDRMSKVRGSVSPRAIVEAATVTSGSAEGLASLELRTSPDASIAELRRWTVAVDNRPSCRASAANVEMGIVFHFLKTRGGELSPGVAAICGAGSHADPAAPVNGGQCRFTNYFTDQQATARTLARLLQQWPDTQLVVRGLDVCADELAVPTWVLRPLLDSVRRAAASGARHLSRQGRPPPPPLRTTVHAGEDFAHLLTGLRHVHEAIEDLDLREGDRIGHGLALGVDAQVWARRVGRAALPLQDRVFDMAWEWSWWTRRGGGSDAGRLAYLASEVADLAEEWFGRPVDIWQVTRLRSDLADPVRLAASGFPGELPGDLPALGSADWLMDRYLRDPATFRSGMATVLIDPIGEVDALSRIGISLREEVSRRALAIEINPTSNLLIGDLTDLGNHPLWRLAPPRPDPRLPPLSVTIGSDDPLVFNCRLPQEYQLLFDAMIMAGLTDSEAMAWLDRARRNGLERRFTAPGAGRVDDLFDVVNYDELDPDVDLARRVTNPVRRSAAPPAAR